MTKRALISACRHADHFFMSLCNMEPSLKGFLLRRRAMIGLVALLLGIWTVRWLMPSDQMPFWMSNNASVSTTTKPTGQTTSNDEQNVHDINNSDLLPDNKNNDKQPPQRPAGLGVVPSQPPPQIHHDNPDYHVDLSDVDAPYIGWPLKRVCQEVTPVEGVVWLCDKNWGGMGNIRNFLLDCLRYGIEAGATGLVMPEIHLRDQKDITDYQTAAKAPLSYMFDEDHFRSAFRDNCPHITIYDTINDVPNFSPTTNTGEETPIPEVDPRLLVSTPQKCDDAQTDRHVDRFGDNFRAYLQGANIGLGPEAQPKASPETMPTHPPSHSTPRLFRMLDKEIRPALPVLWAWPVHRDGPEFANTFGALLRFHPRLVRLARRALEGVRQHSGTVGSGDGKASPLSSNARFLGVHLRTEIDAESYWPTYDEQLEAYLRKASENSLTDLAYVACGDAEQIARFSRDAKEKVGMTVVSKNDVLTGADLDELKSMTWDQQAIVDFIVLAASDYFVGNSRSSFSIFLAQRRNLKTDGLYTRQYKVRKEGYARSFVVGPKDLYFDHWLFIWDAAWP